MSLEKAVQVEYCWRDTVVSVIMLRGQGAKQIGAGCDIELMGGFVQEPITFLEINKAVEVVPCNQFKTFHTTNGQTSEKSERFEIGNDQQSQIHINDNLKLVLKLVDANKEILPAPFMYLERAEKLVLIFSVLFTILLSLFIVKIGNSSLKPLVAENRAAKIIFSEPMPSEIANTTQTDVAVNVQKESDEALKQIDQGADKAKSNEASEPAAKSPPPPPPKKGLLAAFGTGGVSNKLAELKNSSDQVIGSGGKSKSTSTLTGDGNNPQAKDIGSDNDGTSKTVDLSTKGRGSGVQNYGVTGGLGTKSNVQISIGGKDEVFTSSIDQNAVRAVVRSALNLFRACYEKEFRKDSSLSGKLLVNWEIHSGGVAKNARILKEKSTINNNALSECVISRIVMLKFPEPPAGSAAEVTYPFAFVSER